MQDNLDAADSPDAAAVRHVATGRIPTRFGEFAAHIFTAEAGDGREHLACVLGEINRSEPVLVRVHSECITGDVLGSQRCDCGAQLEMAMEIIGTAGSGVLLYLRDHEGRGIGLEHKLHAYELQDAGRDTVEANLHQGLPADARSYAISAQMLAHLGVGKVRLLTNNPVKLRDLADMGIEVTERVPLLTLPSEENIRYLRAKRDKLGHLLENLEAASSLDVSLDNSLGESVMSLGKSDSLLQSSEPISDTPESESHPFPATTHVAPVS